MNTALIENWIQKRNSGGAMELAHRVGIHLNTLNNIRSHKSTPSLDVAKKLAEVLGVSLDQLCGDTNPPEAA